MKSNNSNQREVLKKIAQALRLMQSLEQIELPKQDALEVQLAKGLLMGIIEYSGHRPKYHWLFGLRLLKAPGPKPY